MKATQLIGWLLLIAGAIGNVMPPWFFLSFLLGSLIILTHCLISLFLKSISTFDKLLTVSSALLMVGILFRYQYYPGHTLILLFSSGSILALSFYYLEKNRETKNPEAIVYLNYSILIIYLLFRLYFWPYAFMILIIAAIITALNFHIHYSNNTKIKLPHLALGMLVVFSFVLSFAHADRVFYSVHGRTLEQTFGPNYSYKIWDKYSWFLYQAGKQDEAIEANRNAILQIQRYTSPGDINAEATIDLLRFNKKMIQNNTWTEYNEMY